MHLFIRRAGISCCFAVAAALAALSVEAQTLTVQVGSTAPPPVALVSHGGFWRWHKGTNAPQAGWQTVADASLNGDWSGGPGGFGYNRDGGTPNETNRCLTVLFDMSGTSATNYSTFYIRKSIDITNAVDPSARVQLTMDWDDGFMAWWDGVYITNRLVTGAPAEPAFTAVASATHESSLGSSGQAAQTYDVGSAGAKLGLGTHTLAIVGLNQNKSTSSDFILVADAALASSSGGTVASGNFLSVVPGVTAILSGSNTVVGATRVTVNGDDAVFDVVSGTWSKTNNLVPGLNRVFVAAVDEDGNLLAWTNRVVIAETNSTSVSGVLSGSNYWSSAMGTIRVTGTVTVPAGASLTIAPETVVLLSSGAGISVSGTLNATGSFTSPVFFGPADGSSEWGSISAAAAGASVTLREVETVAGRVSLTSGASMLVEDSLMHHFYGGSMMSGNGGNFTVRRSHLHHFHDSNVNGGSVLAEDLLVEDCDSTDGDPFEMSNATGAQIRRVTLRRSTGNNADAFDCNSVNNVTFENCLIHTVSDKGISIGTAGGPGSQNVVVRNCLIYDTRTGIAFKDDSRASVSNVTIVGSLYGVQLYPKYTTNTINAGGRVTNFVNNILWNNGTPITITNGFIEVNYCDVGGTNWPGTNNISADPSFVNAARRDYRLGGGSPCIGAGEGGGNMGFAWPVGGLPGTPLALAAIYNTTNPVQLVWQDDADNEAGFIVERSTDAATWNAIGSAGENATNFLDVAGVGGVKYYYRIYATNSSGPSEISNLASARRLGLIVISGGNVGGTISQDTLFADDGVFTATSTINVANGATLYVGSGAQLRFNSSTSLTVANGGRLMALGTSNAPIEFTRSGASGSWGGITISGSGASPETHIEWANFSFNSQNPCIQVSGGTVWFDHLTFSNTTASYLHLDSASFVVQNCNFPTATSGFEIVHGTGGIKGGGHGFFVRNFFGRSTGYNDVVDFTGGNRPGPIVHFIDNVFVGTSDDELDLDGTDAWVEHNIFLHCHKNGSPDTSSAVSGGPDGGAVSDITVVGNLFYDVDHAAMVKGGNFTTLINNTIVHQTKQGGLDSDAAVICLSDDGFTEGAGMYLEGNIIMDVEKLMRFHTNSPVTFTNNIIATNINWNPGLLWTGPGGNNTTNDPRLKLIPAITSTSNFTTWAQAQVFWDWFSVQTNSPAIGASINGLDQGGVIPIGIPPGNAPGGTLTNTSVTITPGFKRTGNGIPSGVNNFPLGSGYTHYKWRLDGGLWSAETPITTPISLANLAAGPHTLEVTGKRDSAIYQDDPLNGDDALPTTVSWTIGTADSDGDGIPDDWETAHGLDKNNPADAALDADHDGLTNLQEYLAGTDPQLAASTLKMQIVMGGTNALLSFDAVSNKTYSVLVRDTLGTNTPWQHWLDLPSTNLNRTITLTNAAAQPARFFRVVTPMAP
jgi:hypothetical protein